MAEWLYTYHVWIEAAEIGALSAMAVWQWRHHGRVMAEERERTRKQDEVLNSGDTLRDHGNLFASSYEANSRANYPPGVS